MLCSRSAHSLGLCLANVSKGPGGRAQAEGASKGGQQLACSSSGNTSPGRPSLTSSLLPLQR